MQDSAVGVRLGPAGPLLHAAALRARRRRQLGSEGAHPYGASSARELRAQGYNMSIGGGVNLTREPRNGRNFEYAGEDPLLAGTMAGNADARRAGRTA